VNLTNYQKYKTMASLYELAYLSDYVYSSSGVQQTRTFNIGVDPEDTYFNRLQKDLGLRSTMRKRGDWAIISDNGISNNFYASKFQNLHSGEFVIAFRGTGFAESRIYTKGILDTIFQRLERTVSDLGVDAMHLVFRSSPYVEAAAKFLEEQKEDKLIVTGHSLGGFLAYSMAFYHPLKIVAFNPPYVINKPVEKIFELSANNTYRNSRMYIFESSDDFITMLTRLFKSIPKNIKRQHGFTGGHGIGGIQKYLKTATSGTSDLQWDF